MSVANVGNGIYEMGRGVVNIASNVTTQAGRVFAVLNEDVKDLETAIMLGKVGDVLIKAKETLGFGKTSSSEQSYQGVLGTLDGWNALKTFPDTIIETKAKVSEFFMKQTYSIAMDCVSAVTGLFNAACEVVGFLEAQLAVPCFKGISDVLETSNFQALAAGATARTLTAGERVFSYVSSKGNISYKDGVGSGLDVVKNLGDLAFAVTMLTTGSQSMLLGASALSTASKVTKYAFSKFV
ncbi:MAG: hypothetical protein V4489_03400 [Chlamydiota bacterium]